MRKKFFPRNANHGTPRPQKRSRTLSKRFGTPSRSCDQKNLKEEFDRCMTKYRTHEHAVSEDAAWQIITEMLLEDPAVTIEQALAHIEHLNDRH